MSNQRQKFALGQKDRQPLLGFTSDGRKIYGYNDQGRPICNARKTRNHELIGYCQSKVIMRNGRCRLHGGLAPTGIYDRRSHDKYADILGPEAARSYNWFIQNPNILSMRQEIALNEVRLRELAKEFGGLPFTDFQEVKRLAESLQIAIEDEVVPEPVYDAAQDLLHQIMDMCKKRRVWNELEGGFETKRRMVATELERTTRQQHQISVEKAYALVYKIVESVRKNVTDPIALRSIMLDVSQVVVMPSNVPGMRSLDAPTENPAKLLHEIPVSELDS